MNSTIHDIYIFCSSDTLNQVIIDLDEEHLSIIEYSFVMSISPIIYLLVSKEKALHVKLSVLKGMTKSFISKLMKTALLVLLNESF